MFNMAVPWWELVLRGIAVYTFLIFILRISGKRQIGQMAPFDLVMLLILSNAVQNSMNGGDNSLIGGLLIAGVLVGINFLVGFATFKSKKVEEFIEGRPQVVIHNGVIYEEVMAKYQISHHELDAALRRSGCEHAGNVRCAMIENTGAISVIVK
ncbi:MAG: DUF421 domain-containing protein [Bdellovibrio sp.]|nr:DUF421 domain-containing protein [Methylotenera sp.]